MGSGSSIIYFPVDGNCLSFSTILRSAISWERKPFVKFTCISEAAADLLGISRHFFFFFFFWLQPTSLVPVASLFWMRRSLVKRKERDMAEPWISSRQRFVFNFRLVLYKTASSIVGKKINVLKLLYSVLLTSCSSSTWPKRAIKGASLPTPHCSAIHLRTQIHCCRESLPTWIVDSLVPCQISFSFLSARRPTIPSYIQCPSLLRCKLHSVLFVSFFFPTSLPIESKFLFARLTSPLTLSLLPLWRSVFYVFYSLADRDVSFSKTRWTTHSNCITHRYGHE